MCLYLLIVVNLLKIIIKFLISFIVDDEISSVGLKLASELA